MKIISLLNLKGGVAKSFSTVNIAYELWRRSYKVLLLDNDKQGNLSKAYRDMILRRSLRSQTFSVETGRIQRN